MTASTNTCRCDKSIAPEAQELCNECLDHQVVPCALCATPIWWRDSVTTEDHHTVCHRCDFFEGVPV